MDGTGCAVFGADVRVHEGLIVEVNWVGHDPAEFVTRYAEWYAKELAKGYCVAWISFAVDPDVRP